MKCPYCGEEIPEEDTDVESCPYKPFTIILTRAEIWGIVDNYHITRETVRKKLLNVIGRDK